VAYAIVRLLRLASLIICLIVIASFAIFAIGQTKTASEHQQQEISNTGPVAGTSATGPHPTGTARKHESGLHEAIDEASNEFTSPFAGLLSGSSSEWAVRGGKLVLALLIYGFGIGYIARALRVRV
jgi:hypothetical protein